MSIKISIDGCYTRQGLIKRGWTLVLIKKLLPKPDFVKRGRGSWGKTYLYTPLRVAEKEKTPEFKSLFNANERAN